MSRVVFLLEEQSIKVLLDGLLPRLFPDLLFLCVPHEGKQDLEKSIPRKLRAWQEPGVRFVVLRDNDGANCQALKTRLMDLCRDSGRPDTLVRLACQELEAWYLGDLAALGHSFSRSDLQKLQGKKKFRKPDDLASPADEVRKLIPEFQKVSGARLLARHLSRDRNQSHSFCILLEGLERLRHQGNTASNADPSI